uniref:Uncharacterized protein n=1 Tax=Micrurus surinamensis TaxID=129470 RepID=A0A2D4NSK5_MICSU
MPLRSNRSKLAVGTSILLSLYSTKGGALFGKFLPDKLKILFFLKGLLRRKRETLPVKKQVLHPNQGSFQFLENKLIRFVKRGEKFRQGSCEWYRLVNLGVATVRLLRCGVF